MVSLYTSGGAEKVFAIVGATGVCVVCYVLPVAIHLKLLAVRRRGRRQQVSREGSNGGSGVLVVEQVG